MSQVRHRNKACIAARLIGGTKGITQVIRQAVESGVTALVIEVITLLQVNEMELIRDVTTAVRTTLRVIDGIIE